MSRITFKRTTRKDFEVFKKSFRTWQKRLGLTDWRICFEHGDPGKDAYACLWINTAGRIATVALARELEMKSVDMIGWDPRAHGRHEALELLLASMAEQVRSKTTVIWDLQEDVKHAVIRRLEHLFNERGMK